VFTTTSAGAFRNKNSAQRTSSVASTSMVALSVSISAMMSPDLIAIAHALHPLARLPFSIVGDNAGIKIWIGMAVLEIAVLIQRTRRSKARTDLARVMGGEFGRLVDDLRTSHRSLESSSVRPLGREQRSRTCSIGSWLGTDLFRLLAGAILAGNPT